MTAATTPNTTSRGDWAWPLKSPTSAPKHLVPSPSSPPLELQFLPPSAAAVAAASTVRPRATPASACPWNLDPSRLQKLMMGCASTSSDRLPATSNHDSVSDFGRYFDPAVNKPLPSGWERCLDLKSGEVFIKKCEVMASQTGPLQRPDGWQAPSTVDMNHRCLRPTISCDLAAQTGEQRADWTTSWILGKGGLSEGIPAFRKVDAKVYGAERRHGSPDRSSLCLDLDLRLSDNRSRLASEALECGHQPAPSLMNSRDCSGPGISQKWDRQALVHVDEQPASIQEMVSESTMATAVCSKCHMYVLLKKSNPTCPRCFNPIILDCGAHTFVNKRPRLDLSPEVLSLSTESSR